MFGSGTATGEDQRFGWSCTGFYVHGDGSKMQNETGCEKKDIKKKIKKKYLCTAR